MLYILNDVNLGDQFYTVDGLGRLSRLASGPVDGVDRFLRHCVSGLRSMFGMIVLSRRFTFARALEKIDLILVQK